MAIRVQPRTRDGVEVELTATMRALLEVAGRRGGVVRFGLVGDDVIEQRTGRRLDVRLVRLVALIIEHLPACYARDWRLLRWAK